MTGIAAPRTVDRGAAQRLAVGAALLNERLPPTKESIVAVARHFGGIQIDPTRTVERTQHLVLWSRVGNYDRSLLDKLLAERRLLEWDAFIVPLERLPEIRYVSRNWPPAGKGDWFRRARDFLKSNAQFRRSIVDQLRAEGPLQSRQIDDSKVKVGWQSTGWTHGNNTTRMLEFMSVLGDVWVSGRVKQERLWDIAERVVPPDAPLQDLTADEYEERRVLRAVRRFGVATLREIRLRTYGLSVPDAKRILAGLVERGQVAAVDLDLGSRPESAFGDPDVLGRANKEGTRTILLSPFDPLVYDRDRTQRLFGFSYKLEMYVPKAERQFGHFVLPILHHEQLVGRLDSERDRKTNELVVRKVHWEDGAPRGTGASAAVKRAINELAEFIRAG